MQDGSSMITSTRHLEPAAVLATVKMRPGNGAASLTLSLPADPDGVCARRQRAAMPERLNVRRKCSSPLD
jgi:hypothetical protein